MTDYHISKHKRSEKVNELIHVIADCGRRFFYNKTHDRYATIEIDRRGRIWFIDDYTGKRIYTHWPHEWSGFSHGGTLRSLVIAFREHITTGNYLPRRILGPFHKFQCNGDLWGYGDDMQKVRDAALRLELIDV